MLNASDYEILKHLKDAPEQTMTVESGCICYIDGTAYTHNIAKLLMCMALTQLDQRGTVSDYQLSRVGRQMLAMPELEHQILSST